LYLLTFLLGIVFSVPQFNTMPTTSIWDISTTHTPDPEPTESKSETDPTPYRTALLTSPTPPEESITVPEVAEWPGLPEVNISATQ
jgi:hypothetical protein